MSSRRALQDLLDAQYERLCPYGGDVFAHAEAALLWLAMNWAAEREALVRERQRSTAEARHAWLCDVRYVDSPCPGCSGAGVKVYGSTSTWRGGIGGQAMTPGVCDKCWGSGDAERPWPSWRAIHRERERAERAEELLRELREATKETALREMRELRGEPMSPGEWAAALEREGLACEAADAHLRARPAPPRT